MLAKLHVYGHVLHAGLPRLKVGLVCASAAFIPS